MAIFKTVKAACPGIEVTIASSARLACPRTPATSRQAARLGATREVEDAESGRVLLFEKPVSLHAQRQPPKDELDQALYPDAEDRELRTRRCGLP